MNKTQRRDRLKKIRAYNADMRGHGVPSSKVHFDKLGGPPPPEVVARAQAYVDSLRERQTTVAADAMASAAVAGTEMQRGITHSTPSALTFGVLPNKRSKVHAVTDGGTVAVCGKDVGDWDPTDITHARPWNDVPADDRCKHCDTNLTRVAVRG